MLDTVDGGEDRSDGPDSAEVEEEENEVCVPWESWGS